MKGIVSTKKLTDDMLVFGCGSLKAMRYFLIKY